MLNSINKPLDNAVEQLQQQTASLVENLQNSSLQAFSSVVSQPVSLESDDEAARLLALPLQGMAFAVKEVIDVAGEICDCGCDAFAGRVPSRSADIVTQLQGLGAQVVGITRSTEMAIARETATRNPFSSMHSPGGSSSGSAAAVGAGLVSFALGTQTIGSTVRPAAYCGAVGFKPSKGELSLGGVMTLSPTLDHLGLFADSIQRMRSVCHGLFGPLPTEQLAPPRLLLCSPWFSYPGEEAFQGVLSRLMDRTANAGIESRCMRLEDQLYEREESVTDVILCWEMYQHWGDRLFGHPQTSCFLQSFLQRGQNYKQNQYEKSLAWRESAIKHFVGQLGDGDILVFPSVTGLPPQIGEGTGSRQPQRLWTLLGLPALNLPVGMCQGFPLNLQLIGKPGSDSHLLQSAEMILELLNPAVGQQ